MGVSRSLYLKNGCFLPKTGLKIPILGQKHYFLGVEQSVQGPPTLFYRLLTQNTVCCTVLRQDNGCLGLPRPKSGYYLPKNGLKMAILG